MPLEPLFSELEQNISNEINVDRLADAALLSRSQLYREFYHTTGHSVKEYVRKRRLSRALALIKHTDKSLKQIAKACGYSGEQALCKSIKAAIDQTPKQYRASGDEYYFPACAGERTRIVTVAAETIPPTLCLRYYDSRLKGIENRALAWLFASRPDYSGRIFGRKGAQKGSKLCYELLIEAKDADQPSTSGTFAKATCPDSEDEINAAWDYLYNQWLKTSMFTISAAQPWAQQPWFEEYIHADGQVKRLRLYLPVVKKPGFHKICLRQCEDMHFLVAKGSGRDAETSASKAVMDFLAANHPRLAQSARQFYVSTARQYTCGIALQSPFPSPSGCNAAAAGVETLTRPAGEYAVLEGDCCGDTGAFEAVLSAWIDSMGLSAATTPFAVYESDGSFDRQNIRARIYQKIENHTIGQ